jgi:universal stress protein G
MHMEKHSTDHPQTALPFCAASILVPVDMRDPAASEQAVATAAWFALQSHAELSILTVAHPFGDAITEMPEAQKQRFTAFVADMSARHGVDMEAVFRSHESINHVIGQVIEERSIDLVVMATHQPRLADNLFGSHASQTALHNDCSVLILRGA